MQIKKLVLYFVGWKILLFVFLFLAIQILPLQLPFLGGGISNYLQNPYIFSWLNFDGEHYLDIAISGYKPLTYFYFPLYPLTVRLLAFFFSKSFNSYIYSGLFISHFAFFLGLLGLIKLIRLDYSEKIVRTTVLLLLLFPTSFYFGSFYTESLFFALATWSIYFARKGNWIAAGLIGALSSATRIIGVALFPTLVVEALIQAKENKIRLTLPIFSSFLVMLGIITYATLLRGSVGDPLAFFHSLNEVFGEQRSQVFIMLPQVFYRYIFKILPSINYRYFPAVFTTWLEFVVAVGFTLLLVVGFTNWLSSYLPKIKILKDYKLRESYLIYFLIGYIIPTLSGSFSSLPRYVLVLFPAFILMAIFFSKLNPVLRTYIFIISFVLLGVATALFTRGYWLA